MRNHPSARIDEVSKHISVAACLGDARPQPFGGVELERAFPGAVLPLELLLLQILKKDGDL